MQPEGSKLGFCAEQLERVAALWKRMVEHPFLVETRDGTIPDATFGRWIRQDYLFVEAAVPFLGALLARAPAAHAEPLAQAIAALHVELDLFRERARAAGVDLDDVEPAFIAHAYVQFLLATGWRASYAEAFAVLYGAEKAYHDAWTGVRAGIDPASPWIAFVDNWSSETFRAYVAWLEAELDRLAARVGADERARMARLFETTVKYEIAFWELAYEGPAWPGLGGTGA